MAVAASDRAVPIRPPRGSSASRAAPLAVRRPTRAVSRTERNFIRNARQRTRPDPTCPATPRRADRSAPLARDARAPMMSSAAAAATASLPRVATPTTPRAASSATRRARAAAARAPSPRGGVGVSPAIRRRRATVIASAASSSSSDSSDAAADLASGTTHAEYVASVAGVRAPSELGALVAVLAAQGRAIVAPSERAGLHPRCVPLARDPDTGHTTCLHVTVPFDGARAELEVVSCVGGGDVSMTLLAKTAKEARPPSVLTLDPIRPRPRRERRSLRTFPVASRLSARGPSLSSIPARDASRLQLMRLPSISTRRPASLKP